MSNDCSGLPGIVTAVTHLVCVSVGAPGPWHTAKALVAGSEIAPAAIDAYRHARNLVLLDIVFLPRGLGERPHFGARGCGSHTEPCCLGSVSCSVARLFFSIHVSENFFGFDET